MSSTRPKQNTARKAERLRERIATNERLLSLYDSPFPDNWERRRRNDIREQALLLRYELKQVEGIRFTKARGDVAKAPAAMEHPTAATAYQNP